MEQEYYQFGGLNPHIQWFKSTYDDKRLAEIIAGPTSPLRGIDNSEAPLELVLGIKSSGSSHLLLSEFQTRRLAHAMTLPLPRGRGYMARHFESLSPIFFNSVDELTKKLSSLKPKAKKSKTPKQSEDTSQANRGYNTNANNLYRGTFEHCRVVRRILQNSIDPRTYSIEDVSWKDKLCISALALNVRGVDDRPLNERLENPTVLDVGFCEASLPALYPDYSSAKHLIDVKNIILGRKGIKQAFSLGESERPPVNGMHKSIQSLFQDQQNRTARPMILLVNNEEQAINYLQNMGVDVSKWRYGLKHLLIPENSPMSHNYRNESRSSDQQRSSSPHYSRSPRRYDNKDSRTPVRPYDSTNPRAPIRSRSYAPVYIVDIQQLYTKLMQAQDARTVVEIAHRLRQTEEEDWWCAGNEAPLLIDIFRTMGSGPAIDEQRALYEVGPPQTLGGYAGMSSAPDSPDLPQASLDDSENEQDPNDFVDKNSKQTTASATKKKLYDFDESDYGSDSD